MPTSCAKIKLKHGSSGRVKEWANELNRRADEVLAALRSEGVILEAAFLDSQADGDYLLYIMRSDDFEKAQAAARQSTASIDTFHEAFKKTCWESSRKLNPLIDFSTDRSDSSRSSRGP